IATTRRARIADGQLPLVTGALPHVDDKDVFSRVAFTAGAARLEKADDGMVAEMVNRHLLDSGGTVGFGERLARPLATRGRLARQGAGSQLEVIGERFFQRGCIAGLNVGFDWAFGLHERLDE